MAKENYQNEVLRRLIGIDNKTDSMEDSLAWLVRAEAPQLKEELVNAFGTSKRRVQVYLALDGERNVDEIAKLLGMKGPNVSIVLTHIMRRNRAKRGRNLCNHMI